MADAEASKSKNADLPVRIASAIVMLAVAGGAVWAGGLVFSLFLLALAGGLIWEWWGLVSKIAKTVPGLVAAMLLGIGYIAWSLKVVDFLWTSPQVNTVSKAMFVITAVMVVAVDVGAYFAGRAIGGPKIAPSISPSKTWAGLGGGMVAAVLIALAVSYREAGNTADYAYLALAAVLFAIIVTVLAQTGDFLESWMKRRAGVKDSGNLIPGHGGLLDRLDGHLFVFAMYPFVYYGMLYLLVAIG